MTETEDEIDFALAVQVKGCVAGRTLPEGFADRLRSSVRRSRRMFRLRLAALSALVAVSASLVVGLTERATPQSTGTAALTAREESSTNEQASVWVLLSFFRECIRRAKPSRKEEEE
jgi:hypothetical protein